jgi:hypothetical protein
MKRIQKIEDEIRENKGLQTLLDTPLRKPYNAIISMIDSKNWDQKFVKNLLFGFYQVLKAMDVDYDTLDTLVSPYFAYFEITPEDIENL